MNSFELSSFLDKFSVSDLESLKDDVRCHFEERQIIYFVDTYDILNYTLPFTSYNLITSNSSTISRNAISYEVVFSNVDRFKFILADQYENELSGIIDGFNTNIRKFPMVRMELLKKLNSDISLNSEDIRAAIMNDLELFIVLYIFYKDGLNVFDKFQDFVENHLNIDSFNSGDELLDGVITEILKDTKPSGLTTEIFDHFVENNKYRLSSFKSDFERYCYLDNTYRDISVVDRIYQANRKIENHGVTIRYLSSAPLKTKQIFSVLGKLKNENHSFNRNIDQLFLLNHILDNFEVEEDAILNIQYLIELKGMQANMSNFEYSTDASITKILISIREAFRSYKRDFEKTFYFDSYIEYKALFIEAIGGLNDGSKKLERYIRELNTIGEYELSKFNIENRISPKINIGQTFSLSQKFESISKRGNVLTIGVGKDIIRNTFHHLPYLIFLNIKDDNIAVMHMKRLLNTVSSHSHLVGLKSKEFRDEFESVLSSLSKRKFTLENQTIDVVTLAFLNLITSSSDGENDEREVIEIIQHQKSIIQGALLDIDNTSINDKIQIKERKLEVLVEMDYLLLWLFRRNLRFDEAEIIFSSYSESDDPRFDHGIGLVYNSKAYDKLSLGQEEEAIKLLIESKEVLIRAYKKYEILNGKGSSRDLIIKQQIGILNSIIDVNVRLVGINKAELLIEARFILDLLKKKINLLDENVLYESLETINHTESELEYYEALSLFERKEFSDALRKLNHTNKRIPNYINSQCLVDDRFKSITQKINELRMNIFVRLGIL